MFGAIAGGIASALAGGAMSKLFGGGQKAASGGIQGDVLATDNNTVGMGDAGIKSAIQGRSEERFSRNAETDLVCRLLLEKKKKNSRDKLQCGSRTTYETKCINEYHNSPCHDYLHCDNTD